MAEAFSEEVKRLAKEETVVSDLTYDLRGGDPDFTTSSSPARSARWHSTRSSKGSSGLMAAIQNGSYTMAPIPDPKLGPRHVDVATMYNTERYRPQYDGKEGLPVFLIRA